MPSNRYSFVRGRPPLIRGQRRAGRHGDAGNERCQGDEAAAVQRQPSDLLFRDDLPEAPVGAQRRRIGNYGYGVCQRADPEREIEPDGFAGFEANTLPPNRLEAGQLHIKPVLTWRKAGHGIDTRRRGDHRAAGGSRDQRGGDGRSRNGRAPAVRHDSSDLSAADLRFGYAGKTPQETPHWTENRDHPKHSPELLATCIDVQLIALMSRWARSMIRAPQTSFLPHVCDSMQLRTIYQSVFSRYDATVVDWRNLLR
jgi:hypothetical protein